MSKPAPENLETDPRFPSGRWTGYYLQREDPGRHRMEIHITFTDGVIQAEGRDKIGRFTFGGRDDVTDGRCHWTKH